MQATYERPKTWIYLSVTVCLCFNIFFGSIAVIYSGMKLNMVPPNHSGSDPFKPGFKTRFEFFDNSESFENYIQVCGRTVYFVMAYGLPVNCCLLC